MLNKNETKNAENYEKIFLEKYGDVRPRCYQLNQNPTASFTAAWLARL